MLLSINICYSNEMSAHAQTINTWRISLYLGLHFRPICNKC